MEQFGWHDVHLVVDVVAGGLATSAVRSLPWVFRLIWQKAFAEPVAEALGQRGYRRLDEAVGDKLPDLPGTKEPE